MQNTANLRRIRLASGLILFTYVTTHFLNHALVLISHQTLADGRAIFLLVWRNLLGTRGAHQFFGTQDNYDYVLLVIWVFQPLEGLLQLTALVVAWLHGCIG